jgi:hypothetical protein
MQKFEARFGCFLELFTLPLDMADINENLWHTITEIFKFFDHILFSFTA